MPPQLSTFDLNLLRTLDVLLRERSVTRSATELNVTQQAVSGSLKRLRERFSDALLVRTKHGLEPTPLAIALMTPVRDALRLVALALETVPAFTPGSTQRRFRMAMSDHCSLTVLPRLVAELGRIAQGITCEVIPINRQAVYDMDLGNLDFLIMPKGHGDQLYLPQSIRTAPLFEDRFVCVVDGGSKIGRTGLTLNDYAAMRHVVLKVDEGFRSLVEAGWVAAGIAPRLGISVSGFAEMICAVQGTDLVATVHERLATMFARMLAISVVDCPLPLGRTTQLLYWHANNDGDPTHSFVRNTLLTICTTI